MNDMTRTDTKIHHIGNETDLITFSLEANGFAISLTQSGRYLTLHCSKVPDVFRSLNFVNRSFTSKAEPGLPAITLASRSNPSITSFDLIFLRGAYDDLNDKPYVYDMQGLYLECIRQGYPNTTYRQLAETLVRRINLAISEFKPEDMETGKRMEGGEAQTPIPPRFRSRVTPSLKEVALQKGSSSCLKFDLPKLFDFAKKGVPLLTFGTVLHQEFLQQAQAHGAEILPWGADPVLCESLVNVFVLDHEAALDISVDRASQILSDSAYLGLTVVLVSQEYGLGSIPMKEEHREHMRVMADRQQVAAAVALRYMFFAVPTHYIEGVLNVSD